MRAVSLPYAQAVNSITLDTWTLLSGGAPPGEFPEAHPAWDTTVPVAASCHLELNPTLLQAETGLGEGARLRLVGGYSCESTRTREFTWSSNLQLPSGFSGVVELKAEPSKLLTSLTFILGLVVLSPGDGASTTSARIPGSWLWKAERELRLDQSSGAFPMEWTDFRASGLPENASWFLDWPEQEWEAPLLGAIRLRLNANRAAVSDILGLSPADPKRRLFLESAKLDVAKQLVTAALLSDEFIEHGGKFPEASVGYCTSLLLASIFPNDKLTTLRERLRDQFGEFHLQFMAGLNAFDGSFAE